MHLRSPQYRALIYIVFLVAITLRIAAPNIDRSIIVGDESTYNYSALSILKHKVFVREVTGELYRGELPIRPTSALSPGYPVYIALIYKVFGTAERNIFVSHIVLSIVAFWLMYRILETLKVSRIGMLASLSVAAIYPGFLYNIDRMLTEHLYLTLFLAFIYLFLTGAFNRNLMRLASAGFVLGLATHVRAQAVPFLILGIAFLVIYGADARQRRREVGAFLGLFLLCMLPWWIRNYVVFHKLILLSDAGDGARIWGAVPYFLDMADTANKTLNQIAKENYLAAPFSYIRWKLFGYMNYMWADVWDEKITHPGQFLQRAALITQLLVIVPAIAATPLIARKRIPSWTFVACVPLVVTLLNLPFHGLPRYAFIATPYVILTIGMLLTKANRTEPAGLSHSQLVSHSVAHSAFFYFSAVFAVWLLYSVYFFPHFMARDMGSYRIGKYSQGSIAALERGTLVLDKQYDLSEILIENSGRTVGTNRFRNPPDAPGIFKFEAMNAGADLTKVTLDIRGGAPYDYVTLYWTSKSQPDLSESRAYRIPRFRFETERSFYIEGDAERFLLVPSVLMGNKFRIEAIRVAKFKTP